MKSVILDISQVKHKLYIKHVVKVSSEEYYSPKLTPYLLYVNIDNSKLSNIVCHHNKIIVKEQRKFTLM